MKYPANYRTIRFNLHMCYYTNYMFYFMTYMFQLEPNLYRLGARDVYASEIGLKLTSV